MIKRVLLTLILSGLFFLQSFAAADESDRMPDIENVEKSLTICFFVQNNDKEIPISGAEISIYKVAELNCENGSANYRLLSQFESLKEYKDNVDVTFDGMTVSESMELSNKLAKSVTDADAVGITDISGKCTFNDLTDGMYLVIETNAFDDAFEYEFIDPYIVSVPLAVKDKKGNYWEYEVLSKPKTVLQYLKEDDNVTSSDVESYFLDVSSKEIVDSQTISSAVSSKNSSITMNDNLSNQSNNPVIFDGNLVTTGFITNVIIVFMVLFASAFLIVIMLEKKKKDDDVE